MFYLFNRFYTKLVLLLNADINSSSNRFLHNAVYYNDDYLLSNLLSRGADFEVADKCGYKALYYTFLNGYTSLSNILIEKGAKFVKLDNGFDEIVSKVIAHDNLDSLQLLLNIGASVTDFIDGKRMLSQAVKSGSEASIKLLLEKGADINAQDTDGKFAIHHASETYNLQIIDMLVAANANINQLDATGCSALYYALFNGNKLAAEKLVSFGAKIDISQQHNLELLHHAAKHGYKDVVKYMLESEIFGNISKKIAVNMPDENDNTPFMYAANNQHHEIVQLFVSFGADVNYQDAQGRAMSHYAAMHGHIATLKHLYGYKADFSIEDNFGKTPLYYALSNENIQTASYIYAVGEELDFTNYDNAVLMHKAAKGGNVDLIQFLKSNGADINYTDKSGMNPVYYALQYGNADAARKMFKMGAKFDVTDRDNIELLHNAVKKADIDVLKLLIDKGVSLNKFDTAGHTPIYYAIKEAAHLGYYSQSKYIKVLELLIAHGANVNLKDYAASIEPIFQAIDSSNVEVVQLLMNNGANLSVREFYSNKTPMFYAINRGEIMVAKAMIKQDPSIVNKIDYSTKDSVLTALVKAGYYTQAVELINKYNPDINYKNPTDKDSILHIAVKNQKNDLVKALKEAGFDLSVKNGANLTAYDLAFNLTNREAMELLCDQVDTMPEPQVAKPSIVIPQVININIMSPEPKIEPKKEIQMPTVPTPSAPLLEEDEYGFVPVIPVPSAPAFDINENIDYGQANRVFTKGEFANYIGYTENRECLSGEYSGYLQQTIANMHHFHVPVLSAQEFVDNHYVSYGVYAHEEMYEQYLLDILHQAF
ncbi:MAG: ankyrin repeat domain-containing protein [Alphaproteobacteria bacterium]|nr:ankyrin repeat domain-containing protein [Candidatus Jidaibacter sp.]